MGVRVRSPEEEDGRGEKTVGVLPHPSFSFGESLLVSNDIAGRLIAIDSAESMDL